MLDKKKPEWENVVKLIGISIDDAPQKVITHVEARKWTSVLHYHRHHTKADKTYGCNGVPHVFLVNKEGIITFIGHPASVNLEDEIDKLAKATGPSEIGGAPSTGAASEGGAIKTDAALTEFVSETI